VPVAVVETGEFRPKPSENVNTFTPASGGDQEMAELVEEDDRL